MDDNARTADFAVHELTPRARSDSSSSGHKRSLSGSLLSRLSFLRLNQGTHTDRHRPEMEPDDGDDGRDQHARIPHSTSKGGTTSSRAMSAAIAQHRTRRRRGSLRKTALLVRRTRISSSPNTEPTPYPPREPDAFYDNNGLAQPPTWFHATTTQKPTHRPSINRRRQGLAQHNLRTSDPTTDDEDIFSFPRLRSSSNATAASLSTGPQPKPGAPPAGLEDISPPPSTSGSFYPLQAQPEPTYMPVHRHKSSPLVTHPVEMKSSPEVDVDYSETEWWGWIILIVTWLVFVVGIGSCFGVWSWAWDVGETPYAPPELEDDPTLPIVGYYPALIILTAVMSWVWVVVAWIGMKYFKHANISGDDI
ncbi:hypothetical protein N7535_000829 [Penicillium sp. DV-2018c]|nr:hypothetical protein N7535_000829 [Penicillium sp. DV-2018c]